MSAYPNLRGDLDARPILLQRLNALASHRHVVLTVSSGRRTLPEQRRLYANRASNPYPVAPPTPNDPHIEGVAADVSVNGRPIQEAIPASQLRQFGLQGLSGDAVHVQVAGTIGKTASQIRRMAREGKLSPAPGGSSSELVIPGITPAANFLAQNVPGFQAGADLLNEGYNAAGEAIGGVGEDVVSGIVGDIAGHAEALMLNIALIGGGAFLIYYGAALLAGIDEPALKLARATKKTAEVAVMAAPK